MANKNQNSYKTQNTFFLQSVKLGYNYLITNSIYLFLILLLISLSSHLSTHTLKDLEELRNHLEHKYNLFTTFISIIFLTFPATLYFMTRPRAVYLLDHAVYKPVKDERLMCKTETFMRCSELTGAFTEESLAFQRKISERSGYGESTYMPESVLEVPAKPCMEEGRKEMEKLVFGVVDEVMEKSGVTVKEIGIVVVNSGMFSPTPSLSAMIVNRYKLGESIVSYNLGGMGCSAGLISIDLAKELLKVHPDTYASVISTESITVNWYLGNKHSMLVSNYLLRMGGAAILLSNHRSDRHRSKYQLIHTVRTHKGADDLGYKCVYQEEDDIGCIGAAISKDLPAVAGEALKTNISTLGPLVLPMSEQLLFFATMVARKVLNMKIKPYVIDFKLAFDHFCVHAGGRAVLDEVENKLNLSEWDMEPSRMTLYRFGNTSSGSLWYELAYFEAKGRISKGDRLWQIAFGSGFKCNSAVLGALRTVDPYKEKNAWMDEIDSFTVH